MGAELSQPQSTGQVAGQPAHQPVGRLAGQVGEVLPVLLSSSSPGVATIARVSARELRTTSGGNNYLITNLGPTTSTATSAEVWEKMRKNKPKEIKEQLVRLGLLLQEL